MSPLTREDFELECDLARWEAAMDEETERRFDDAVADYRAMNEAEAVELAAGATMRPFEEE